MSERQRKNNVYIHPSPEVHSGENVRWVRRISRAFPALSNKRFRYYFLAQSVSLAGTWLQIVAQGWLVLQLTQSAFLIGLVTALSTLPSLFFTLFGGVIVDRYPKKNILVLTQSVAMVLALVLGALTLSEVITIRTIAILAFMLGMVTAVDAPARQAFVAELVKREQLASAISLNSGSFNAARIIGPSMAGILIAIIGTGGAFIANGVSYIVVILVLLRIKEKSVVAHQKERALKAISNGIRYSYNHPVIRILLILAGVISIFGWAYSTLMPLIAQEKLGLGATGLGILYAASGAGSFCAAIIVGGFSEKKSPTWFILGGNFLFAVSIFLFSLTSNLYLAGCFLFLAGMGLLAQAAMINTTIQNLVQDRYRGRVMSLNVLMFLGMTPLGNLQMGWVAEHMGVDFALRLGGIVVLIFGILLVFYRTKIRKAYRAYKIRGRE